MYGNSSKRLGYVRAFIICFSLWASSPALSETLQELNAILAEAPTLDAFLADKPLQDRYFTALNSYYGGKVARSTFDNKLKKVEGWVKAVPTLGIQLWEDRTEMFKEEAFEFSSSVRSSGRGLQPNRWREWREKQDSDLSDQIGLKYIEKDKHAERIKEVIQRGTYAYRKLKGELDEKYADRRKAAKTAREKQALEAGFQTELKAVTANPDVQRAIDALYREAIHLEAFQDALNSGDADVVLDAMARLKDNPRQFIRPLEEKYDFPNVFVAEIKKRVPTQDEMINKTAFLEMQKKIDLENAEKFPTHNGMSQAQLQQMRQKRNENRAAHYEAFNKEQLFPIEFEVDEVTKTVLESGGGQAVTIRSEVVPRPFIGLMDPEFLGECVGGNCERWGVIAMQDVRRHHLTKNKKYQGFVQLIPGTFPAHPDRGTWANLELGSPLLRQNVVVEDPQTKTRRSTTAYEMWLEGAHARKPKEWKGFMADAGGAIGNAGVLPTLKESPSYGLRSDIGTSKEFEIQDALAREIPKHSKTFGESGYSGRMVTDATVPNATGLREVKPIEEDDIEKFINESGKEELVVKLLAQPKWALHPKAPEWANLLMTKEFPEDAQRVSSSYYYSRLDSARRKLDKAIFEHLLVSEYWAGRPGINDGMKAIISREENGTEFMDKVLSNRDWTRDPNYLGWLLRYISNPSNHMNVYKWGDRLRERYEEALQNPSRNVDVGDAELFEKIADSLFYGEHFKPIMTDRRGRIGLPDLTLRIVADVARADIEALQMLGNLGINTGHRHQGAALRAFLDTENPQIDAAQKVGFVSQYLLRSEIEDSAESGLHRQMLRLAEYARQMEDGTPDESLLRDRDDDSSNFIYRAANQPRQIENLTMVVDWMEANYDKMGPEGRSLLSTVLPHLVRTASPNMAITGMFGFGGAEAKPERVALARKARALLVKTTLDFPMFVKEAFDALKDAIQKKGFDDNGQTKEAALAIAREYPELFEKDLSSEQYHERVLNRIHVMVSPIDSDEYSDAVAKLFKWVNSSELTGSVNSRVRQNAAYRQMAVQYYLAEEREGVPTTGRSADGMRAYQSAHSQEFDALCAHYMAAMGKADE